MYDVGSVGMLFIVFAVFFILAVVICYLFLGSLKDWKRINEIKKVFKMAVEEIKKDTIELSSTVGDIREALSCEGESREKELIALKSRTREKIEKIKRVVNRDFRKVEAFMKDVEAEHALKSLSRNNVESFKKEMRQKQWLITCIKDHLVVLGNSSSQLEVTRGDVTEKGDNDENASPIFVFKRILQKIMKQITEYEMSESMKRQEELLRYNRNNHLHYLHHYNIRNLHSYNFRSTGTSYYSSRYSSSVPQFNSPRHDC